MNDARMEYFLKLAECLSFTKAADELFISQPTLSREISLLERELGVQLFDRRRKHITLTKEGMYMLPVIRRYVERGRYIRQMAQSLGNGESGIINLGYSGTADSRLLTMLLTRAAEKYPNISFNLTLANHARLIMMLREGALDLALSISPVMSGLQDIYMLPIARKTSWLCVPRDHPLARRRKATLEDLRNQTLIVSSYTDTSSILDTLKRELNDHEIDFNIAYCNSDPQSIFYLVLTGKGLAFSLGDRRVLEAIGLGTVSFELDSPVGLVAACMERDRKRPALQNILDVAAEVGREYTE